MQLKLQNGFAQMSDAKLETRSNQILESMTGNINFPSPVPSIPDLQMAIGKYSIALALCATSDRVKIAEKNELRMLLIEMLHKLARYVLFMSDDNNAIALTSGFNVAPERQRRVLSKPDPLILFGGKNPGEISCIGNRVIGARSYIFQYATHENMSTGNWSSIPSTHIKTVLPSLSTGVLYYCRVAAIGSGSQVVYSDVVSRTAA